jgi:hypothetical protein
MIINKSHVILVSPSFRFEIQDTSEIKYSNSMNEDPEFPLNLGLLGSILIDNGYTVDLINSNVHSNWHERIYNILNKREDIAYIGFTVVSSQAGATFKLAKEIKQKYPTIKIVFGGVHPTLVPNGLLKGGFVDFCVVNEGDVAVVKLVEYINGKIPLESVPNIVTLKNGNILVTEKLPLSTFDVLPQAMHPSLYENDMAEYIKNGKPFSLLTGLGCNYQCAFCINNITKRRYRSKKAESIYAELKALNKRYGIKVFIFQEEHFFADRERLFKLLELFENDADLFGKIKWITNVRVTDIKDSWLSVPLLKRLVKAGCISLAQVIGQLLKIGPYVRVPFFQTYRPYPGSIWETDLSRFEDPEAIPDEMWRMQLVTKERLSNFGNDADFLYNLISITQVMCLSAVSTNSNRLKRLIGRLAFPLCAYRIRTLNFNLMVERKLLEHIRKKYTTF